MSARGVLAATLLAAASVLPSAAPAGAQPSCGSGSHLMSYPTTNPVWEFCWRRPQDSTGPNGSGLEIHDVYYKGKLVFKRAHVPILNVKYLPGGCGGSSLCYRDWFDQEVRFQADNQIFPGYSEPTTPPMTVCEVHNGSDVGSFYGVAAEKLPTQLILTTQCSAGWYRYTMRWFFQMDGVIRTEIGFAAVSDPCVSYSHTHHGYWRFDFDIEGAAGDAVFEGNAGLKRPVKVAVEDDRIRGTGKGNYWTIRDLASGRGFKLTPGLNDEPADAFGVADAWILAYKANEIDDSGQPGPPCAIKIGNYVTGENVYGADVVFWYGGRSFHQAGELDECHIVGPTLTPIGTW